MMDAIKPGTRCNRCHRPMLGTTAYDGACACGGLIEAAPSRCECQNPTCIGDGHVGPDCCMFEATHTRSSHVRPMPRSAAESGEMMAQRLACILYILFVAFMLLAATVDIGGW